LTNQRLISETRGFFINTLFDSTFTLLGIIVGSAFTQNPDISLIIGTLITSSLALGISSGVSVYEAEKIESEKELEALEDAMLADLEDSMIEEELTGHAWIVAIIIFLTPLLACLINLIPFFLSSLQIISINLAGWIAISLSLGILFFAGYYFGEKPREAIIKGLRMVVFGALAFILGVLIKSII
jgi:predicted membrane protein (TIGR00267 family)